MKKSKLLLGLLAVVLVMGLVFSGCDFLAGTNNENGDGGSGGGGGGGDGGGGGNGLNAPTGVTATTISSSSIKISWNDMTDVIQTGYRIYRSDNASGPYAEIATYEYSFQGTSYTNYNLSPATTFYYKVAAIFNYLDTGSQSSSVSATTWMVAPTGVNAVSETSSSVKISWNNLTGATAYRIFREGNGSAYTEVGTSTSNSYTDTGLPSNVTYTYTVSGYNSKTEGDRSSESTARVILKAPTGVTATADSSSSITITWNAVTDATGYHIYRSDNPSGPYAEINSSVSGTSYTNADLSPATTFYYKVSARNSLTSGEQSEAVSATTTN